MERERKREREMAMEIVFYLRRRVISFSHT